MVLGARAEATLPVEWWLEGIEVRSPLAIKFIGPEVRPREPVVVNSHLRFSYHQGHFSEAHSSFDAERSLLWLPNPGLAHPHLAHGWRDSLARALDTGSRLLVTAHSEKDLAMDVELLRSVLIDHGGDFVFDPAVNPFRSLKVVHDPLDEHETAQANYGQFCVRAQAGGSW